MNSVSTKVAHSAAPHKDAKVGALGGDTSRDPRTFFEKLLQLMHELFPELGLGRVVLQERKNVVRERTRLGVASEDKRTEGRISGCDSRGATCSVRATDIGSRVLTSHGLRWAAFSGSRGIKSSCCSEKCV